MAETKMNVTLLAHTQLSEKFSDSFDTFNEFLEYTGNELDRLGATDGQAVAFTAIRTCYSANKPSEIVAKEGARYFGKTATDGEGGTEADRLFRQIVRSKHLSTLEHLTFTFAIEGVSRALLAQLTRHRIGFSYSVQSQRYNRYFKDEIKELKDALSRYKNDQKRHGLCKLTIGEELRIVDMYLSGMSTRDISKETDIPHTTIIGILHAHNVDMRNGNESVVDHDFFEKIDSHRKAQILGFICADGSVGSYERDRGNEKYTCHQLSIEVNNLDGYYLQHILDDLRSRNSLSSSKRGTNSISIVSEKLISDLGCLGVTQNKTLTLDLSKIIENVPSEYMNSFMLGYFEGDGYVSKPDNSNAVIITTGSETAAKQIQHIIKQHVGIENVYIRENGGAYRVSIHGVDEIEKTLCWMYKDIDLDRVLRRKLITASYSFKAVDELRKKKLLEISNKNSFVIPEKILNKPEATFTMIDYFKLTKESYVNMVANGIPQEDARAITGQGMTCNLVMTANLRALLDFYSKRKPGRGGQFEITQLAEELRKAVVEVEPWTDSFFEEV